MKKFLAIAILFAFGNRAFSQAITLPPSGGNQKSSVTQWIGPVSVTITYSSPNVHAPNGDDRKGKIWGGLVHYGYIDQGFGPAKAAPWRAGANENTTITFSNDVKVEGKDLKAGTYGLFLGVEKDGPWTWIFSKNADSWGSYFYDQNEDALRVQASPLDCEYTEYLTYGFDTRELNTATAYLQWENKRVPMKIEVPNVNDLYVGVIRNELRNFEGFDSRNIVAAINFCVNNKTNLDEALVWANNITNSTGVEDFNTISAKANVLYALNRESEANVEMDKAMKHNTATVQNIHQYGRMLLGQGKKEKALEVFKFNRAQHPDDKFTTFVGLARGYTAMGDTKNAIKNWEIAIKNLPDNQKQNLAFYEGELKKLKGGA